MTDSMNPSEWETKLRDAVFTYEGGGSIVFGAIWDDNRVTVFSEQIANLLDTIDNLRNLVSVTLGDLAKAKKALVDTINAVPGACASNDSSLEFLCHAPDEVKHLAVLHEENQGRVETLMTAPSDCEIRDWLGEALSYPDVDNDHPDWFNLHRDEIDRAVTLMRRAQFVESKVEEKDPEPEQPVDKPVRKLSPYQMRIRGHALLVLASAGWSGEALHMLANNDVIADDDWESFMDGRLSASLATYDGLTKPKEKR